MGNIARSLSDKVSTENLKSSDKAANTDNGQKQQEVIQHSADIPAIPSGYQYLF